MGNGNHKIIFLTSSPDASYQVDGRWITGPFTSKNGFLGQVRDVWQSPSRVLVITATPDEYEKNDEMIRYFEKVFAASGLPAACIRLLDRRTEEQLAEWLSDSDFVVLGGGHVPTQNAFFKQIGLREQMEQFSGVIMGISAGTMNCADLVYAQPELAGEAVDPSYEKFITGLGLTQRNVLPHYQMVKDNMLDGMRLMEEITYGDSAGHAFYALEDGSYIRCEDGEETLYGNAYLIKDGTISMICRDNESRKLAHDHRTKAKKETAEWMQK